jgi:hypothetical protein
MDEYLSSLFIGFSVVSVLLVRVGFNVLHDVPDVRISLGTYDIQRDSVSFTVLDNGHVDLCESLYIICVSEFSLGFENPDFLQHHIPR